MGLDKGNKDDKGMLKEAQPAKRTKTDPPPAPQPAPKTDNNKK